MSRKIIAFLQARTDSTRLPKKVLKTILDKPMIIHQLQRTQKSKFITQLIVLTSDEESDNQLANSVMQYGFKLYRGSKNNVLKRFYDATLLLNLKDDDLIVRLTGDCPLHDATIIDESIEKFMKIDCDYLANCIKPIYPDGLDVEVFNFKSLKLAYKNARLNSEREHVTPYIRNSGLFKVVNLEKKPIYNNWRLTVDEESDFKLITKIYEHFNSTYFSFSNTIEFLEKNKKLLALNHTIIRNEGYLKSLEEDSMQGTRYCSKEADKWFERNKGVKHNIFTEYLLTLFPKQILKNMNIAEFGVGRGNNINLLSQYVNSIDGYDGSQKSIEFLKKLRERNYKIDGKCVNLVEDFQPLQKYNIIIFGFFTYMITDKEFNSLVINTKNMLEEDSYVFIYDFLSLDNKSNIDSHNKKFKVYKRNLNFYIEQLKDFTLIDFRLYDNRRLHDYLLKDNLNIIDVNIDDNDYNWTFSALFKLSKGN